MTDATAAIGPPTALLFAGQGTHGVGMGDELMARCGACRALFETADDVLGYSLTRTMREGPEAELRKTTIAQPALLTVAVARGEHLRAAGMAFSALAGHSVGQYAALVVASALRFEAALLLVHERGRLMQDAVPEGRGAMAVISGLERTQVASACASARDVGVVGIACHNAPLQTVISGERSAVGRAMEACEDEGAGAVELPVTVPFHSPLLEPMMSAFGALVDAVAMKAPTIPVIDNVSSRPLTDAVSIRRSLKEHVLAPVLFEESLRYLASNGTSRFVGAGRGVLSLARKTVPTATLVAYEELTEASTEEAHGKAIRG